MAFAQNLLEGFAQAAGDQPTVQRIENEKSDRRATQHEELAAQTQSILNDVTGLQQRRGTLDPKSTTYQKDLAENDKALHDARQALHDLYHPEQNPGALAHLGGFIRQHLSKTKPQVTPAQAKQSMQSTIAGLDVAASAPNEAARIAAGLEPKAAAPKAEAENWQVVPEITLKDGRKVSAQHNTKSGEWSTLSGQAIPQDLLDLGATVQPKAATAGSGPIRAWKKKNGKVVSVLLDRATNKEIPGSENPDIAPPAAQAGRISTGFYHWVDDNNQLHSTPETRTSMPAGSGGAFIPTTPGEAKDRILGTKANAATTGAEKKYLEAFALSRKADEVALKPNDAVNQKRLAVALERISAGRFTTQALDYILKAGWGNTIQQWANNPTTGALPPDIMRQRIYGAHQERDSTKAAWDEAKKGAGGTGGDDMITVQIPGQAPGKIHASQKAAFLKKYPTATVQ